MIYTANEIELAYDDFVPVPVKAGSALLIDGLVRHRSGENVSAKSRHAYTFHVYDSGIAKWSEQNWQGFNDKCLKVVLTLFYSNNIFRLTENPTTFLPVYDDTKK